MPPPIDRIEEQLLLSLSRTFEVWNQTAAAFFRSFGLSPTQYNVLRILRGAGAQGLNCSEIAERMVNRDPDITRLMDRLEKRSVIERRRSARDRRVVIVHLTAEGAKLLDEIEGPLRLFLRDCTATLGEPEMSDLIERLSRLRDLIQKNSKSDCNPPHLSD